MVSLCTCPNKSNLLNLKDYHCNIKLLAFLFSHSVALGLKLIHFSHSAATMSSSCLYHKDLTDSATLCCLHLDCSVNRERNKMCGSVPERSALNQWTLNCPLSCLYNKGTTTHYLSQSESLEFNHHCISPSSFACGASDFTEEAQWGAASVLRSLQIRRGKNKWALRISAVCKAGNLLPVHWSLPAAPWKAPVSWTVSSSCLLCATFSLPL